MKTSGGDVSAEDQPPRDPCSEASPRSGRYRRFWIEATVDRGAIYGCLVLVETLPTDADGAFPKAVVGDYSSLDQIVDTLRVDVQFGGSLGDLEGRIPQGGFAQGTGWLHFL